MAVELHQFLSDQLEQLATSDPDRRLLEGLQETLAAYIEQTGADTAAETTRVASGAAATAVETSQATELYHGDRADPSPAPAAPETPSSPERDRVTLHGRLGAAPRFRTSRNNVRIGSFPLAVREDDDSSVTWWRVQAFNNARRKTADLLEQLNLSTGAVVEVIGYRHEVERRSADGTPRTEQQVYAAAIKAR